MKTITVTYLRTHAFRIIKEVEKSGKPLVLSKRGKSIAEIIPINSSKIKTRSGKLASALVSAKDIISPLNEQWETLK